MFGEAKFSQFSSSSLASPPQPTSRSAGVAARVWAHAAGWHMQISVEKTAGVKDSLIIIEPTAAAIAYDPDRQRVGNAHAPTSIWWEAAA